MPGGSWGWCSGATTVAPAIGVGVGLGDAGGLTPSGVAVGNGVRGTVGDGDGGADGVAAAAGALGNAGANEVTTLGVGVVGTGVGEGGGRSGDDTIVAAAPGVDGSAGNGTLETSAIPPRPSHAPLVLVPTKRVPSLQRM